MTRREVDRLIRREAACRGVSVARMLQEARERLAAAAVAADDLRAAIEGGPT